MHTSLIYALYEMNENRKYEIMRKVFCFICLLALISNVSDLLADSLSYNFDDGNLNGWANRADMLENYIVFDTSSNTYDGRCVAYSGNFMLLEGNYDDRDSDTVVKVITSPEFILTADTSAEIWSLGGTGATGTPQWANISQLPETADESGFMGAALRRVSDGEYFLFNRRSTSGQSNRDVNWLNIGWDQISGISGDDLTDGETYVIDIIDTYSGGWGWIGIDSVSLENVIVPGVTSLAYIVQPLDLSVVKGFEAVFSVAAYSNDGTLNYKWYKQGEDTVLSESSKLVFNTEFESAGYYYCVISNQQEEVTSDLVELMVKKSSEVLKGDINDDYVVDVSDLVEFGRDWLGVSALGPDDSHLQAVISDFRDSTSDVVQVASHRGDWKHAPENSLPAIRGCIDMGIAFVEIDVRKTKDGRLVLMHDSTVDRTTNGSGNVSSLTLDEIKALRLKNSDGSLSQYQVPTLEEAMFFARGKIMVNLDKAWSIRNECLAVLVDTDTVDQGLFKSSGDAATLKKQIDELPEDINFMYIVSCSGTDSPAVSTVMDSISLLAPDAIEVCFGDDEHPLVSSENIEAIRQLGVRVWVNSLWSGSLSGGHPDGDTDTWDWLMDRGVTIIQTDYPQMLQEYVEEE